MDEGKSRYELFLEEEERKAQPTKRCSRCKEVKTLSEFHKQKRGRIGVVSRCKDCIASANRVYKSREDRFWKFFWTCTERVDGCLIWKGMYSGKGKRVPMCKWEGKQRSLRRVIYRLAMGALPDDMFVLMTCQNRKCVSQYHMKLGSSEDRELDRTQRILVGDVHPARQHPEHLARGEKQGNARLNTEGVREIRSRFNQGESKKSIAKALDVGESTVGRIIRRESWAHVQ